MLAENQTSPLLYADTDRGSCFSDRKTDENQMIRLSKNLYGYSLYRRGPVSSTCFTAIPGGNKGS